MVADVLLTRADADRSRYPADPVCGHYLGYLEDRPDQVVAAVRTIAGSAGPVLVHCAAGKDRTGVVVALALSAVGVRPEAIVADYAATGERTGALIDRLRRSPTYASDINSKPAASTQPRPGTMTAFLEQVTASVRRNRADGWPGTASAATTWACSAPSCCVPDRPPCRARRGGVRLRPSGSAPGRVVGQFPGDPVVEALAAQRSSMSVTTRLSGYGISASISAMAASVARHSAASRPDRGRPWR